MIAVNNPNRSDSNTRNISMIVVDEGLNISQSVTDTNTHTLTHIHRHTLVSFSRVYWLNYIFGLLRQHSCKCTTRVKWPE